MKKYTLDYKGHVITVQLGNRCVDLFVDDHKKNNHYLVEYKNDGIQEYAFITPSDIEKHINQLKDTIDEQEKIEHDAIVHLENMGFKEQEITINSNYNKHNNSI